MANVRLETDWQVSPRNAQNAQHVCRQTGTNEHQEPVYESIASVCGTGEKAKQRAKQIAASGRALEALHNLFAMILAVAVVDGIDINQWPDDFHQFMDQAHAILAEVEGSK